MRVRVSDVLELVGAGEGVDEILGDYPDLEREDIYAALLWAARLPRVMAHTAALLLTATSLWFAAGVVTRSVTGGSPLDDPPLPLPVALVLAVVAAALATYAAGPGGRLATRLAVLALSPAVAVATHLVSEQVG